MARLSIEEKIEQMKAQIKELRIKKKEAEKAKAPKASLIKVELGKDSPGVQSLLDQFESVAKQNNVKNAELIKLVSRLKRTGLKIEDRMPRSKKQ